MQQFISTQAAALCNSAVFKAAGKTCVNHKLTFHKILLKIVIERQKFMMISFTENWKPRSSHEIKPLFSGKLHR